MAEREKLIELKDLQITFGSGKKKFVAVDHVNFDIYKGETFSLVGESGSGKTTIGRAICRINPTSGGDIFFKGQKINGKIPKELDREVIRKVQMIFQDPMASLNERAKVEYIVAEGLLNHHLYKDQDDLHEKVMNALHEVGLLPEFASRFPHEFSGGQRQRRHRRRPAGGHGLPAPARRQSPDWYPLPHTHLHRSCCAGSGPLSSAQRACLHGQPAASLRPGTSTGPLPSTGAQTAPPQLPAVPAAHRTGAAHSGSPLPNPINPLL